MDIASILRGEGYARVAILVYQALLANDALSPTEIMHRTQLHRPSVYRGLDALEKGQLLVAHTYGKRLRYTVHKHKHIPTTTPSAARYIEHASGPKLSKSVETTSGEDAIRHAFDRVIAHTARGDTFLRITSEKDLEKVNSYLSKNYRSNRDKKRLERLVISNAHTSMQKRPRLERFIRHLDSEQTFNHNVIKLIYGNTVTIIQLDTKEVITMTNASIAAFERSLFMTLYRRLPR
jgi:Fe2+ or Zn2+ uptake regulation protein